MNKGKQKKKQSDYFESFKDKASLRKYVLLCFGLPILLLILAYLALEYMVPLQMTVKVYEQEGIPSLPFEEGRLQITYAGKTEYQTISEEAVFNQIASKHKGKQAKLIFTASGFQTVDTTIILNRMVLIPIKRDDSLKTIFGVIKNEDNLPVIGASVCVLDICVETDENGYFSLTIPLEKQKEEQELIVQKEGYKDWRFTGPPSTTDEWRILLKKV